jgi:Zn-dependent protease
MTDLFGDPETFLQNLILKIPALLLAVTVHEFAHGIVADRLGDPTPRRQGRLTLNPLPHIDVLGAIAFVLAGFGWAKPVEVNARNLRHPTRDMAWVAAAGPLSNLLTALAGLLILGLLPRLVSAPFLLGPLAGALFWIYLFNVSLAIFNLIPLPPLDGGHFLPYFLPRGSGMMLQQLRQYGPIILILLVMTGATGYIVAPVVRLVDHVLRAAAGLIL